MTTRVAVQQRHRLLREGLELILVPAPEIDLVGLMVNADDFFTTGDLRTPDVVLVEADVTEWDVCRLAHRLRQMWPAVAFVGTYAGASDDDLRRLRNAGLRHLVSHRDGLDALIAEILSAAASAPSPIRIPAVQPQTSAQLTDREIDILELIGAGLTSREISNCLEITHKTVENHKQRIFGKLGVQNQGHAVSIALRRGLIGAQAVLELAERRS